MGKFEDQLLRDLMQNHGQALATAERPETRNTRPIWLAAGAVTLAGAVTVGLTFVDGGTPAAYAINQNADGSISVSIKDIAAIDPANKELERLGVPIRAVPVRPDCPNVWGDRGSAAGGGGGSADGGGAAGDGQPAAGPSGVPAPSGSEAKPEIEIDMQSGGGGVKIERSVLTPGASIALAVYTDPGGTVSYMSMAKIESGPMPTCLPPFQSAGVPAQPTPN
jgi:hypothetical protein